MYDVHDMNIQCSCTFHSISPRKTKKHTFGNNTQVVEDSSAMSDIPTLSSSCAVAGCNLPIGDMSKPEVFLFSRGCRDRAHERSLRNAYT